ncbi:uncharacterized protein LOC134784809 [Penaeus indicus]|uniref:uncharacterized protein LOC134784809 n=1 Tax=Penaeus indicus TaxID=29960 RepID=UPI00300D0264
MCNPPQIEESNTILVRSNCIFPGLGVSEISYPSALGRWSSLALVGEETTWEILKNTLVESAEETLPKKKKDKKQKWMTDEILSMMSSRQKIKNRESNECKDLDKRIKEKCTEAKENWLNRKCVEIERNLNSGNDPNVYKKINEISNRKTGCSNSGCIRAKDGTMLVEKAEIFGRWTEYISELFDDVRIYLPRFTESVDGPKILPSDIREALRMKRNKAAGPDGIVMEMIELLGDYGVEKLTEVVNKIYDDGVFPDELSKSIFIALPKKPGAVECELHRTISLMSHVTKIILRVLLLRVRNRISPEIGKMQFGFVKDAGTRYAVFALTNLLERAVDMQKKVFLRFIDYTKAFDKVRHILFEDLCRMDLHSKDLRLLQNLSLEQERGLKLGGHNTTNIRYADDTVLLAESEEDLQRLLDMVVRESEIRGITNEEVFRRAGVNRKLICDLRGRQMRFLGHVMRKDDIESLALTGKIEGKRSRGRRRFTWMSSLRSWLTEKGVQYPEVRLLQMTKDREAWHAMIANVLGYGT